MPAERRRRRRSRVELSDGSVVELRPVQTDDKPLIAAAFERLSAQSRYRRFFTAMKELGPATLTYLTEVDHHDHEAIVALTPAGDPLLGVARYVRAGESPEEAEAAIAVIDDWQGRGLGRVLLQHLARRARAEGVSRFTAVVKVENPAALEILRGVGDTQVMRDGSELRLLIDLPPRGVGPKLARALHAAAAGTVSLVDVLGASFRSGARLGR